jgi:hypothetical protein
MVMVKKFVLIMTLCLLVPFFTYSQFTRSTTKVGTTVSGFLKIPAGARSIGMGSAGAAVEGDIYSIYWNPGALARINSFGESTFNNAQWLADINYNFAATGLNIDGVGAIGLSLSSLQTPEDIVRTEDNPNGDGRQWKYTAFSMGVSFARSLTDRFSVGVTAKYIRESLWHMSANGFAVDVGTIYTTSFNGLKIGASITNFGTKMRLDGYDVSFNNQPTGSLSQGATNVESLYKTDDYDIPLTFRIGLSMDVLKLEDMIRATVAVDAIHPNDNSEYVNSGIEVAFNEMFFGRAGYQALFLPNSEQGLTWGVGINIGISTTTSVKVDYAFGDYGRLINVQYLTVSVTY